MEPDLEYPIDLPDLEPIDKDLLDLIDRVYEENEMNPSKVKMLELEKRMISHLMTIADMYEGTLNFSIPGVVFMEFSCVGLKPKNQYNFYFESEILRCNNQINYHQKSAHFEKIESEIDDKTIGDNIVEFILSIPMEETKEFISLSPEKKEEFSNPF